MERSRPKMTEYNSVENYANLFADILCDVQADEPEIANNIVEGFKLAIAQMLMYHRYQADEYSRIQEIVNEIKIENES